MTWELKEPRYGDIVRVKSGNIWHYGIYVSDDEIIQFGNNPSGLEDLTNKDVKVISTNVNDFILDEFLEVAFCDKKEKKAKFSADKIVKNARSRLGQGGYHILYNNCEHFVNECGFGKKESSQVENVRDFFKNFPILNVYYAVKPSEYKYEKVLPKERQKEIACCKNEKVKSDKYFVWRLLEYGLKNTFGLDIKNVDFVKNEHGKWQCPNCFFSLSHSEDVVAVAISNKPVGVDVEVIKQPKVLGLENKILSDNEFIEFSKLSNEEKDKKILEIWSQKESVFKMLDESSFKPKDVVCDKATTTMLEERGNEYCLSVANVNVKDIKISKIDLKSKEVKKCIVEIAEAK